MDLNKTMPAPEPVVKVARLPRSTPRRGQPEVFDGGEALPESVGVDLPHPISTEEREALIQAGYDAAQIDEIAANHSQLLEAMLEELPGDDDALGERTMRDTYGDQIIGTALVDKGFTNSPIDDQVELLDKLGHPWELEQAYQERQLAEREAFKKQKAREQAGPPEGFTRHVCIVTPCSWYLDVPPVEDDVMSLMGGVSPKVLEQAQEVEQMMFGHLAEHTIFEWAKALKQAQATGPAPGRITSGYAEPGIIPGPTQRDPARAAAVAAVDARLGRSTPAPAMPVDAQAHDDMLRARRRQAREQAKIPTAYDLTPRWSSELGDGVVGIKR